MLLHLLKCSMHLFVIQLIFRVMNTCQNNDIYHQIFKSKTLSK